MTDPRVNKQADSLELMVKVKPRFLRNVCTGPCSAMHPRTLGEK